VTADERTTVLQVRALVADFVHERHWEPFHNPKDLAAAISIEAAELQELFLWATPEGAVVTALAQAHAYQMPRKAR